MGRARSDIRRSWSPLFGCKHLLDKEMEEFVLQKSKWFILVGTLALAGVATPALAQDEAPAPDEALAPDEGDPFFEAVRDADVRTVQSMLSDGADANASTERGLSALAYASIHGLENIATALIAAGADADAKDPAGATPIGYAAQFGHVVIVDALIEAGADVNVGDTTDWTPLIRAAVGGQAEAISRLLAAGADASATSFLGKSAQTIAETNGDQAVLDALNGVAPPS